MSNVMELDHDRCVGCGACVAKCPMNCITMKIEHGFYYPQVDEHNCIYCGKCQKVCQICNQDIIHNDPQAWYAGYAQEEDVLSNSTSGGICAKISEWFLKNGGQVYGAAFDEEWNLKHSKISCLDEVRKYSGSKYMQSSLSKEIYTEIRDNLRAGKSCLFIGTPCQVAGIEEYLASANVDTKKFFTVDFMCHGIPSPVLGKRYIKYLEERKGRKVQNYNFRSKKYGWSRVERREITYEDGRKSSTVTSLCPLHRWFGRHLSIRKSCFYCQYRRKERASDITVADFWGIEKYYPAIPTEQGVSAIQINTENGLRIYEQVVQSENVVSNQVSEQSVWDRKTALCNYMIPETYNEFWFYAENSTIRSLIRKYPPQSIRGYLREIIKEIIRRIQNGKSNNS